jgi:type II secretory pathway pseudopilin PulG
MEEQTTPQQTEQGQGSKIIWPIVISVIITAIIVGLAVYFWQTAMMKTIKSELQGQITTLQNQINQMQRASSNEQTEDQDMASIDAYSNSHYKFSLEVPENLAYCLNDFCDNSVEDKNIQYFKIDGYEFLKYQRIEAKKGVPTLIYLEIEPRKNSLGMSAVDFAKRSLELNRQYRPEKDYYAQEAETVFAGENAFTFIASSGFEERGLKHTYINGQSAVENAPEFFESAGEGRSLESPHQVIYFDHNGFMYRIMYPIENKVAVDIIDSFKFID